MLTAAYAVYAVAQAALAVWAFILYRRRSSAAALTLLLPIAAVVYDNALVALGSWIGAGPTLEALSVPRFLGHALLTPIWTVTALLFALRVGAFTRRHRSVVRVAWVLYAALVVIGLIHSVLLFSFELVRQGDIVYYTNGGGLPGPPIPSITMLLVVLACSVVVLQRTRWPWMLAGSAFMFAAAVVPTELVGFAVSNSGEVALAAALVATEAFLQRRGSAVTDTLEQDTDAAPS